MQSWSKMLNSRNWKNEVQGASLVAVGINSWKKAAAAKSVYYTSEKVSCRKVIRRWLLQEGYLERSLQERHHIER